MVSRDSPDPNPTSSSSSSMLHHFIVSDSMNTQSQFGQHFDDAYNVSALRVTSTSHNNTNFSHQSFGLWERQETRTRHLMDLLGAAANENHQRLSLSLCSNIGGGGGGGSSLNSNNNLVNSSHFFPGVEHIGDDYPFNSYGAESFGSAFGNSRYLIPTQSLLDEVVNIGSKNIAEEEEHFFAGKLYLGQSGSTLTSRLCSELRAELCSNNNHEFQITLAKLIGLLEEVEMRYEKYYQQMQQVVSSFESLAGIGAAKSYTALALQAMSRHFGSLRNAIISQINVTRRKFCHDLPIIDKGLSQLSLLERDSNKHNRLSLQQLGMIPSTQRQAWRPIRGLPETSVAILRSWLFEHFLHPYPTDSEKLMLASQTGLTKNQVSNWFINARVRLWKPMIEEMYKQEFDADSPQDSDPSLATTSMGREADATDQSVD